MRILFVTEYFYPFTPGGAEWSVYYLAKALVEKGHQVGILTPNYGAKSLETKDGIKIYRFPFLAKLKKGQHSVRYFYHANPLFYFYNAFWIGKIARQGDYELIHAQNRFSLPGSFLAAKLLKLPVFFYLREATSFCPLGMCTHHFPQTGIKDCDFKNYWQKCSKEYLHFYLNNPKGLARIYNRLVLLYLWLDNRFQRFFLNRVDGVTALSQGILDVYQKSGVLKEAVPARVIPSFPSPFTKISHKEKEVLRKKFRVSKKKIVLYVGKFSRGKGVFDLVYVAKKILEKDKDVVFLFIGKGRLKIKYKGITVFSSLPHEEILKIYQIADIVVIPSINPEGLSRVLVEAANASRAVITADVKSARTLIKQGKTGLLFKPGDRGALVKSLRLLLKRKDLVKKFGLSVKKEAAVKLDIEKIISSLINFCQTK